MENDGCLAVLLVGGLVVAPIVAFILGSRRQSRADSARRRHKAEQQHALGVELTELFEQLGSDTTGPLVSRNMLTLLEAAPAGYHHDLVADGGWFDRVARHLFTLLRTELGAPVAERYFHLFTFPSGYQAKALEFLHEVLKHMTESEEDVRRFQRIAGPVLLLSSSLEAQWLYARTLDLVRATKGDTSAKALALYVGRYSYASARPDRTLTLYDEQAIANDIAVRVP